jgi:hypothetical protein
MSEILENLNEIPNELHEYEIHEEQKHIYEAIQEVVKEFLDLDDADKKAKKDLKVIQYRKKELNNKIISFMKENNRKVISFNGGKLKYEQIQRKKTITKKDIIEAAAEEFSELKIEKLLDNLYKERQMEEYEKLTLSKK